MKKFVVASTISLLSFSACVKDDNGGNTTETTDAQTYLDVSYGTDAKQKIDIYLPANRKTDSTKTVVVVHGGGWAEGDKKEMSLVVDSLRKRFPQFSFVNVNYRLAYNNTNNLFPTQENDLKAAIDFYLAKSAEYKVSKDLIMAGASAGAHLALLHTYKNDPDKHVKAMIDYFGPTDLHELWNVGLVQQLILIGATGKFYDQDPTIYEQSNPLKFITSASPPTIIFHGGADQLVPPSQSDLLKAKLTEKTVTNQLFIYASGGHGDWSLETYSDSFEKTQVFLKANVH